MSEAKIEKLTKETDFSGWLRVLLVILETDSLCDQKGNITDVNERKVFLKVMGSMHSSTAGTIPSSITRGSELIQHLKRTRMVGNQYELKKKYRDY